MAQHTIILKEKQIVADGTILFVFEKPVGYQFQAGQYVAVTVFNTANLPVDSKGLTRSLSLSSAPYEPMLFLAMRSGETTFKKIFWQMVPGDMIKVTDPVGNFIVTPEIKKHPIVFLVGGIGITPVRSILKQMEHDQDSVSCTLLYANRLLDDASFLEELSTLTLAGCRTVSILSQSKEPCLSINDERGYINETLLRKYVPKIQESFYYIVGSLDFSNAMEMLLNNLGVAKEHRKQDLFTGLRVTPKKENTL
ncbi:MAG: FAD-dependent oxidoreductase [Minisyncoccota bacterium]